MPENILNSNNGAEVVHPPQDSNTGEAVLPQENSNTGAEVVHPPKAEITPDSINNMSSEEFGRYLSELDNKPDEADDTATDDSTPLVESDVNENNSAESDTAPTPEDNTKPPEPFKTYSTEEEYNADIDSRVNSVLRSRMKKHRDLAEKHRLQAEKYSPLLETAKMFYPDSDDPLSSLSHDLEIQAADSMKISVDDLHTRINDRRDAQKYRDEKKVQEQMRAGQDDIINGWHRDAEQLKYLHPDFDFNSALQNPEFKNALRDGKSVFEAYSITNKPTSPPKPAPRQPIAQNAQLHNNGTGGSVVNPSKLSSSDFMSYIDKIRNK